MSQPEINPIKDWESEELCEAELDALAGGIDSLRSSSTSLSDEPTPLVRQNDSLFTSYFGARGSTEFDTFKTPLNVSLAFP